MSKITNDGRLNPVWHRMLYSCTHMTKVGVKGLISTRWSLNAIFLASQHRLNKHCRQKELDCAHLIGSNPIKCGQSYLPYVSAPLAVRRFVSTEVTGCNDNTAW